tara:strand:- start:569 stop:898 length:330 start_codon:yes stop_codon:yes gene_type:complete
VRVSGFDRSANFNQTERKTLVIDNNVKIIKHKVGLLNLAEELGNVSRACKVRGLSRDTFYRYKSAVETGGVEALSDQTRRKPNHKNRVEEPIELTVKDYAIEYLANSGG